MSITATVFEYTVFFVIFGAISYMSWQFAKQVLSILPDFHFRHLLDYPVMSLAVFAAAVQLVAAKHRLDEWSLSAGLGVFGLAAVLGVNPRPACAAMILMIALFNTVRPARKKASTAA